MTTLFVTASGTDVGKTFVAEQLLRELRAAGRSTLALKPVASGYDETRAADSDAGRLLAAQGLAVTAAAVAAISPWRFAAPLSPDIAASREGRSIPFAELVDFCRAPSAADVTLIEGIGGVMVPLDSAHTVLDWVAALRAPALLVAGSYLGTLSHTLTAAEALRARGCGPAAVIVSESAVQPVPLADTIGALERFVRGVPLFALPRGGAGTRLLPFVAPLLR